MFHFTNSEDTAGVKYKIGNSLVFLKSCFTVRFTNAVKTASLQSLMYKTVLCNVLGKNRSMNTFDLQNVLT